MIGEYLLETLCDKYKLSKKKLVNKNNNILVYGEFKEIDDTLNYLINELKISTANIEKCPSILYRNVNEIKDNINFLKQTEIKFGNIETCLHVLSTDSKQLIDTYNYVLSNYGIQCLNKNTSVLSYPVEIIQEVEKLNLNMDKGGNLLVAVSIGFGITSIDEIKKIIQSKEFKDHPELFTSETLAHAKLSDIRDIIQSKEFQDYPELFASTTLAHAKLVYIQTLLNLPYFKEEKYKKLLSPTVLARGKKMITMLPILFEMAEKYGITDYINTSFILKPPSQNYALINYLIDNGRPLVVDSKLNSIFGNAPSILKKKYGIDIKVLIEKYPCNDLSLGGVKK